MTDERRVAESWVTLEPQYEVGEIVLPTGDSIWTSARILGWQVIEVGLDVEQLPDGTYREIPGTESWGLYYDVECLKRDGTPHRGYGVPHSVHPCFIQKNVTPEALLQTLRELKSL